MLLQMAASHKFTLEMGDVKTAFLQGDRGESQRDVYAKPVPELARYLGLTAEQTIRLEGAVYGLRNAPRRWWHRVKKDMEALGWRSHQLDQCVFLRFCDKTGDLIGICGIYVDDFLIGGSWSDPRYAAELAKVKALYTFGKWDAWKFTLCGVDYEQDRFFNIKLTQRNYTNCLKPFDLPHWCKDGGTDNLSAHGVKQLLSLIHI